MSAPTEDDVALRWDRFAERWHRDLRGGLDWVRDKFNQPAFFEFIGDISGLQVLDAGCGDGYTTRQLAGRGARVTGLDLSPEMVRLARQEEQDSPLGIRYDVGSYTDLGRYGTAAFDRVICFMSLMDGPHLDAAIRQFLAVLRPGGELCFAIPHPCFHKGTFIRRGGEVRIAVGGYFERVASILSWRFLDEGSKDRPGFAVPRFRRTLSDYFNAVCRAGFRISAVGEPSPSEEACRRALWMKDWRRHAAMFLHVRALKP